MSQIGSPYNSHNSSFKFNRFSGKNRFQTSTAIAQQYTKGQKAKNMVLASAYSFPDALAASTLANQMNASIVLIGNNMSDSQATLDYIKSSLASGGNIIIIGGTGVIGNDVQNWLQKTGYCVNRLGGKDRYDTDSKIIGSLNVPTGTPVVIASGDNFPDALGVASIAASKGWPILLSGPNQLPQQALSFVQTDQPTDVYIVGGNGVLHDSIQSQVQTAAPNAHIQRFGGDNRFETLSQILYKFFPDPTQIYVANGLDFADALSGSTLAAQNNAPILLIDPKAKDLPSSISDYLITLRNTGSTPQVSVLGGTGSVPDAIVDQINEILQTSDSGSSGPTTTTNNFTVSSPTTSGITVNLNYALNGLTAGNFTITNSSGYVVPVTGVSTANSGSTYTISAALTAGQTYTVTANYSGVSVTSQTFTVPNTVNNQTFTVSNPTTSGLTVNLSSALSGLGTGNFTLQTSAGYTVPISSVASTDSYGLTYTVNAALTAGQTYTLSANYNGSALGTVQTFTVPNPASNATYSVSNPTENGFTVNLSSAVSGLTASNFTLQTSSGYVVPVTGVTTSNGGLTYYVYAGLSQGQAYTLTANYNGITLGSVQTFTVPYDVSDVTYSVSSPSTTGITVNLSSALSGLSAGNFTLQTSSGSAVAITGVSTANSGTTYTLNAALVAGQTYTLTANYNGSSVGSVQTFTVPYDVTNITFGVSSPATTGLTVNLSSALNGLSAGNFTLKDNSGNVVGITAVTTSNSGATYTLNAALLAGQTYTVSASYNGSAVGTTQTFTVPAV